jgi:plasmid segregation protein ParM
MATAPKKTNEITTELTTGITNELTTEITKYEFLCGTDIGNSKTEISYRVGEEIVSVRQPSVITRLLRKPPTSDLSESTLVEDLLNNLSVQINSPALRTDGTFFVGKKAFSNSKNLKDMNIVLGNKVDQDVPIINTLSMIAAINVKKYYQEKKSLPSQLMVDVSKSTAIPSSEFTASVAKRLEDRLLGTHLVALYIGEKTVMVAINIVKCKVTEEGKTSMLAFKNSSNEILRHYNATYQLNSTPKDFKNKKSLHIDIGDGTSEFTAMFGYNPIPDSSHGERLGVGHATNEAITLYREELKGVGKISRQSFMELLQEDTEKAEFAREKLEEATILQSEAILEATQEAFVSLTESSSDFFFVHGGGSIVFKDDLYDLLVTFANSIKARVVWIPEEFATHLQSKGNLYLAEALFKK